MTETQANALAKGDKVKITVGEDPPAEVVIDVIKADDGEIYIKGECGGEWAVYPKELTLVE
jgi:hypothetical protein